MNTDPIIKNISKHITLDKKEEDYFISILRFKKLKRKELLLSEGEIATHTNYILKGSFRNYRIEKDGVEHIAYFAIEDWWISDILSFLTASPSRNFVEAVEDSEVLELTKVNLEKLYLEVPKFERFFRILRENAFIGQYERIIQNISLSAEERYINFRTKYPQFEQRFPQKQIASYLGLTPEFLSVIRSRMAKS
ncbi:MAG: Crp/Fnr family transcriptional regulator [Ferruginibacter sp.]